MKIAIDARVATGKMHGINRYLRNFITALAEIDHENEYILISNCEKLRNFAATKDNFNFFECNAKLYSITEQLVIPGILKKKCIEIYHSPTFSAPVFSPCKVVMTIHDMIHLIYADQYSVLKTLYYKLVVKTAAQSARGIITVSENSKKDIVRFLNVPDNKVHTVYNGVRESFVNKSNEQPKEVIKKKYGIPGNFVLFVGNEKPHKNAANAIKAFNLFSETSNLKYSFLMLGVSREYIENILERKLPDNFVSFNEINNDVDLVFLYQASSLLLCPSFYEGFGFPLLEGMACGVPVVTSDNSSIPEVVGDAALFVDPDNIRQISEAISRVLSDKNLREDLIQKGIKRSRNFTLSQAAKKTLRIYKEVFGP